MPRHDYTPVEDDELPGSFRHRQRTLQRWRISMLGAFLGGIVVTMLVYPRILPCKACAPCHGAPAANIGAVVDDAVRRAVSQCPTCPSCPSCPGLNAKECPPAPACPACELTCPRPAAAPAAPSDADVVARHRARMLSRPMLNIAECKPGEVCRGDALNRSRVIGQKGITLWMTGLSGSGKTTIAEALEKRLLYALGKIVFRIDGDNLRTGLTRDLGFSPDDRAESVRRAAQVLSATRPAVPEAGARGPSALLVRGAACVLRSTWRADQKLVAADNPPHSCILRWRPSFRSLGSSPW